MMVMERLILPYGMTGEIARTIGISYPTMAKVLRGDLRRPGNNRHHEKKLLAARRLAELKLSQIKNYELR
ncbi:MAG: hypothetical protein LBU62_09710 [Bacteroidales bacterium]|jgi:hypothetical protein|nr:hypothetical protein [Bacteroidales bacterium]